VFVTEIESLIKHPPADEHPDSVFTTNKKPDAFMNTSYLEACCEIIEKHMEYPSDELLLHLVKIQMLSQSISMNFSFRGTGLQMDLPVGMIVRSFQQQIESYKTMLPQHLQGDGMYQE